MEDKWNQGTPYSKKKEQVRQEAIEWQYNIAEQNYSYSDLVYWYQHFYRLGRRYGLLREFRENGIV